MRLALSIGLAAMTISVSCATAAAPRAPVETRGGVRFTLARQDARSVAVSGSFNQWSNTANPLARSGSSGVWSTVIPLPPGEHAFMFVVDGTQFVSPPAAEDYVDDGFGARNGIVVVRSGER